MIPFYLLASLAVLPSFNPTPAPNDRSADLIVNGSFEVDDFPNCFFTTTGGGSTQITGWTVTGGPFSIDVFNVISPNCDPDDLPPVPTHGSRYLDLQGSFCSTCDNNGGVVQMVSVVPGAMYALSIDYFGEPGEDSIVVSIDGFESIATPTSADEWQTATILFQASSSVSTVHIYSQDGQTGVSKPFLDNVRMSQVNSAGAVMWSESAGGNGHWYSMIPLQSDCWDDARDRAQSMGADLAISKDALTNQFIHSLIESIPGGSNVCIGGSYDFSDAIWKWVDGTPFDYTNWQPGEPSCCAPEEYWLDINPATGRWRDRRLCVPPTEHPPIALIEWSADCNSDGIVDYGQILAGVLDDLDGNGVPDSCQACPADLDGNDSLNFFDVAAFLGLYQLQDTLADFESDGQFNFFDVAAFLIAFNAGCP